MNGNRAFSLIELLVVIVLIGLLSVLALPALRSGVNGFLVTSSGNQLAAMIERARVHATTSQRVTAVRFYRAADGNGYDQLGVFELIRDGNNPAANPTTNAISRLARFQEPIILSQTNSPALAMSGMRSGTGGHPSASSLEFREFLVYPDGSSSLSPTNVPRPYFTILAAKDEELHATDPQNPFVLSLDPVTTRVTIFRRE